MSLRNKTVPSKKKKKKVTLSALQRREANSLDARRTELHY